MEISSCSLPYSHGCVLNVEQCFTYNLGDISNKASQMAAIPLYTQTIASLHGLDPAFPAQLGVLNLDKAIAAGSPMHIGDLEHAEAVALVLDGYSSEVS